MGGQEANKIHSFSFKERNFHCPCGPFTEVREEKHKKHKYRPTKYKYGEPSTAGKNPLSTEGYKTYAMICSQLIPVTTFLYFFF